MDEGIAMIRRPDHRCEDRCRKSSWKMSISRAALVRYTAAMEIEASIAALRDALLADERVATAILFGSAATGLARRSSDLDVAVIARSAPDVAALEASHLDLVGRLSVAAGRDVQLILLERAEPVLGRQAFLRSRTLFDRDPSRTADVLERILIEYFDGEYHRRMRAEALERRRAARRG
jgi:predicted nucleotidyltransferase